VDGLGRLALSRLTTATMRLMYLAGASANFHESRPKRQLGSVMSYRRYAQGPSNPRRAPERIEHDERRQPLI
jgi:hypothetical protein